MTSDPQQLSTGTAALDQVLGGGVPARQVLLIAGHPGSGKTILASQIAFHQATRGMPVLMATAASEPHTKILETLHAFSFFQRERVGREMFLLSIYPWLRKGVRETREMLLSSVRERKARLLVIDGLRSLRDVWRDESSIREFLSEVGVGLASNDCTGVFTIEAAPERILELSEAATVDGVMTLASESTAMRRTRRVEVVKIRGRQHIPGQHSASLGPGGFSVALRLEALPAPQEGAPRKGRSRFGVPALDEWLGGGLPAGGVTLLTGEPGTGKSLLAASFASSGAATGEPALFASFQESPEHLIDRARAVCIPLEPGKHLELWSPSPLGVDPDGFAHELIERAAKLDARRVVIDSVDALEESVEPAERRTDFLTALARMLKAQGREVLMTRELRDFEASPLTRVADSILQLRLRERDGETQREMRAVKIRSAAAPRRPWWFHISSQGCHDAQPTQR